MKTSQKWIIAVGNILTAIGIAYFVLAMVGTGRTGEAYIGTFDTQNFNENWSVSWDGNEQTVSLPVYLEDCRNVSVIMENILPENVTDGMRLCMRSALQELRFYIDGELRGAYESDNFPYVGTHLPSSYVMVDLTEEDAGKPISIHVKISDRSKLNEVSIGYGNNAWFALLRDNLAVVIAAILLVAVGLFGGLFFVLLHKRMHLSGAIFFLGQTMVIVGLWILSESHIRQLIFRSPSYSSIFAYILVESLGGFVALYFDSVQKRKYQKAYQVIELLIFGQIAVNIILSVTGIAELYSTILFSHAWLIVGLCFFAITAFIDIRTRRIREYFITALGMVAFLVFCVFEMLEYYLTDFHILGKYLCAGFIILLFSTIVQAVLEEFERIRVNIEKEKFQAELERKVDEQTHELRARQQQIRDLFVETVTALSEAVDAKDRYTSGHSRRVAEYARMIAVRMGKTPEEQDEIYRAGLLHDVGKIRIPNGIINKAGRLTDEEYNIIKIHPVTGYHILKGIAGNSHIAIAAKYHHERYDGKGYPNGLAGENIPEMARILGVADAYDAMASDRSYRKAMPQDVIRSEIEKGRGTQFDPAIAEIMLQMIDEDTQYTLKQPEVIEKRLLVIDDEVTVHNIILDIMNDEPMYHIFSAYDTEAALDILERQTFSLILLDMKMPGTDGWELLHLICEKYQTPVVLMTEERNQDISLEFERLGCEDYIAKPFLPPLLLEIVHTMTEKAEY